MLLGVFLWPGAFTMLVANVDDVPMVSNLPCTSYAAVLGDDVSAEDDECRFGRGTCWIKRLFPPFPPFLYDVGVLAVLVSVEFIYE